MWFRRRESKKVHALQETWDGTAAWLCSCDTLQAYGEKCKKCGYIMYRKEEQEYFKQLEDKMYEALIKPNFQIEDINNA